MRLNLGGVTGSSLDGPPFEVTEGLEDALVSGKLPHPIAVQPATLANVDAQGVLEILFATVDKLHDNRVLRGRHWEGRAAPLNADRLPDRVLVSVSLDGGEIDAEG